MKKILFIYMASLGIALIFGGKVFARSTRPDIITDITVSSNKINIKAVRNFVSSYKNAENVRWSRTSFGSIVYCLINGIKTEIRYDKAGAFLYKIRTYSERNLPAEVRGRVKSVYFDFSITAVDEITSQNNLVYLVHMTDNKIFKTIRVDNDDMSEYESFIK